jgi:hypothetical protein
MRSEVIKHLNLKFGSAGTWDLEVDTMIEAEMFRCTHTFARVAGCFMVNEASLVLRAS